MTNLTSSFYAEVVEVFIVSIVFFAKIFSGDSLDKENEIFFRVK